MPRTPRGVEVVGSVRGARDRDPAAMAPSWSVVAWPADSWLDRACATSPRWRCMPEWWRSLHGLRWGQGRGRPPRPSAGVGAQVVGWVRLPVPALLRRAGAWSDGVGCHGRSDPGSAARPMRRGLPTRRNARTVGLTGRWSLCGWSDGHAFGLSSGLPDATRDRATPDDQSSGRWRPAEEGRDLPPATAGS